MTNNHCPSCARPLVDGDTGHTLGSVRYCSPGCVVAWVIDHNRRQRDVRVTFDRRTS